jgi:uncharacterized RDD family membrane protein YckC
VAAPLLQVAEAPLPASGATAGPWIRYGARLADVLLFTLILDRTPLWNVWAPQWLGDYARNQLLTGVLSGVLWLPFEAFGLAWKSMTPGKWLYSLGVRRRDGAAPGTVLAIRRTLWVFMAGLAFGLRPAAVVLLFLNYRRILRGEPAYWDSECGTVVERRDFTAARLVLGLLVTVILAWLLTESRSHQASNVPTLIA